MIVVLCTTNSIESAKNIANTLIKDSYAACVNIVPRIVSVYKWQGEIVTDEEYLLVIKTRRSLFGTVEEKIKSVHPYETPEIISFDISDGSKEYLDYIMSSCN